MFTESRLSGSETGPQRSIVHQPALDGLRGLAIAGVLLFHGGHLAGGHLGVDAFFVLSGFLITTLLLVEHGNRGRISLPRFWARRARRLLPALVCVIAAVLIYASVFARPGEIPSLRGDVLATLFYVANWREIAMSGGPFRVPSPLLHTWSLAIEEQFYLVWPIVIVGVLGRRRDVVIAARRVFVLSVVLAFVSAVLFQVLYHPSNPARAFYGTDTRAAAVLIGAALAAALVAWGPVRGAGARRALEVAAIVAGGLFLVAAARMSVKTTFLYRGGLLLCGLAIAIVIAAAVHPERGPLSAALSWRPLCWLGIISYGVYLWHWPIFLWVNQDRIGLSGWLLFACQCAVTLLVALVSYVFIERPIRLRGNR